MGALPTRAPHPADADLIFEIHATGSYLSEREEIPKFELALYDPRTHAVLWALAECPDLAIRNGHRHQNFDRSMAKLLHQIKHLLDQGHIPAVPIPPPP